MSPAHERLPEVPEVPDEAGADGAAPAGLR